MEKIKVIAKILTTPNLLGYPEPIVYFISNDESCGNFLENLNELAYSVLKTRISRVTVEDEISTNILKSKDRMLSAYYSLATSYEADVEKCVDFLTSSYLCGN